MLARDETGRPNPRLPKAKPYCTEPTGARVSRWRSSVIPGEERSSSPGSKRSPDLELRLHAADHVVGELGRAEVAAEVGGATALRDGLEARLANRAARALRLL